MSEEYWEQRVTLDLSLRELYVAHKCMESVEWMGEICEFIFAKYEPLTDWQRSDIVNAMKPFTEAWHGRKHERSSGRVPREALS